MHSCFRGDADAALNPVNLSKKQHETELREPEVSLDTSQMGKIELESGTLCFNLHQLGQEAVVVKGGSRLCGTGAARSSEPIRQNKAYWEVKVQQSGIWSCGVSLPDIRHFV